MSRSKIRIMLVLGLLLGAGFMAISLIGYFTARSSLSDQIAENALPLTSDNVYSEIQQDLLRPIFISSLMAHDTFLRDWVLAGENDPTQMVRYLKEIQAKYGTITSFFVSDKTRTYYHPTSTDRIVLQENPADAWYFRVRAMTDDYEINLDRDTFNPDLMTVFINYRVYDYSGNFIGVTGVGLAVDAVRKKIEAYQKRYGRQIYFIDREGYVSLHGEDYKGRENIRTEPGLAPLATQILASPSGSFTFERDGKTVYLNSRLVPEFKWLLIVEQDYDPSAAGILKTLQANLLISFGITIVVLFLVHIAVRGYQNRIESMAHTDALTSAITRQGLDHIFDQTIKAARRRDEPTSIVLFDLDRFKTINDSYGHMVGDAALVETAESVRGAVRESDVLCRWGGEEFLVLLPNCNLDSAALLAAKMRVAIADMQVPLERGHASLTASFGVAELKADETQDEAIGRADAALYVAKAAGRNRVERAD